MVRDADDAPLDASDLDAARKKLGERLQEIKNALDETVDDAAPIDLDLAIGRLSRMDEIQRQQLAKSRRHTLDIAQKQVEAALTRLDDGRYGECLRCGENIGKKRLTARPEAWWCLACQSGGDRDDD